MAKNLFPHESETVEFRSAVSRPYASLWPVLLGVGLGLQQEVWSMPRRESVPDAQSQNTVSVSIFLHNEELYLDEEEAFDPEENPQWNRIELKYLLATLPEDEVDKFTACVENLSTQLQLPIWYEGQIVGLRELQTKFHQFCDFLGSEYGGAGSQTIGHFIDIHYS